MSEADLSGYVRDAMVHAKSDEIPEAELADYIAAYIGIHCNFVRQAFAFEVAYSIARAGIDAALDVRDPESVSLRYAHFSNPGHMKDLQAHLQNAVAESENSFLDLKGEKNVKID